MKTYRYVNTVRYIEGEEHYQGSDGRIDEDLYQTNHRQEQINDALLAMDNPNRVGRGSLPLCGLCLEFHRFDEEFGSRPNRKTCEEIAYQMDWEWRSLRYAW